MSDLFYALHQQLASTGISHPTLWLIERKRSRKTPWVASVGFPISLTYSALEFFIYECDRIKKARGVKGFEGARLIMKLGEHRVEVDQVEVGA